MEEAYRQAKDLALKIDELANNQLGHDNNYLIYVMPERTKNSRHPIPKGYDKDFIICVRGSNEMETPKELKLPKELEGLLIYHEQAKKPNLANFD